MRERRPPTGVCLRGQACASGRMVECTRGVSGKVMNGLPRVSAIPQWTCLIDAIGYPRGVGPEVDHRVGKLLRKHDLQQMAMISATSLRALPMGPATTPNKLSVLSRKIAPIEQTSPDVPAQCEVIRSSATGAESPCRRLIGGGSRGSIPITQRELQPKLEDRDLGMTKCSTNCRESIITSLAWEIGLFIPP